MATCTCRTSWRASPILASGSSAALPSDCFFMYLVLFYFILVLFYFSFIFVGGVCLSVVVFFYTSIYSLTYIRVSRSVGLSAAIYACWYRKVIMNLSLHSATPLLNFKLGGRPCCVSAAGLAAAGGVGPMAAWLDIGLGHQARDVLVNDGGDLEGWVWPQTRRSTLVLALIDHSRGQRRTCGTNTNKTANEQQPGGSVNNVRSTKKEQ